MSINTINPVRKPSFGMPVCGHAPIRTTGASFWATPAADAATAVVAGADRTYALAQGVVAFGTERRTSKGSRSWRAPDC